MSIGKQVDRVPMNAVRHRQSVDVRRRSIIVVGCMALSFVALGLRLWFLQIGQGATFRERSETNRLKTIFIPPPRGVMVDRRGTEVVANRPSFHIEFIKEDAPDPHQVLRQLAEVLGLDPAVLVARMEKQPRRRRFEPKLLLKDVSRDVVARVSAARYRLPGVFVAVTPARLYPFNDVAGHVVGYLREVTNAQLENANSEDYLPGDLAGQYGLELSFERFLKGQRGLQRVIVNSLGTRVGELSADPVIPGNTVELSLDMKVQQAAEHALKGKRGAVVAMDPRTGEILAMASAPSFHPGVFEGDLTKSDWSHLLSEKRLINKAIQGTYPPGSVFKVFMEGAILAERIASPRERIHCPGSYWFKGRQYRCHKKSGHGSVDLRSALIQSCDVYFYTMGQRLGVDTIHRYASAFGFDELSGISLGHEAKGVIPSTLWKRRTFKKAGDQKWYAGETISVSIGQGAVSVTPLQVARALAAVVNGGRVMKPILVRSVTTNDGGAVDRSFSETVVQRHIPVSPEALTLIRSGMVGVVNEPSGTARRAQLDPSFGVVVGGKTGTAQVVGLQRRKSARGEAAKEWEDHAWFAGYAPEDNPEIVVAALVENGGHGGAAAAPVSAEVMTAFFESKRGADYAASVVKQEKLG